MRQRIFEWDIERKGWRPEDAPPSFYSGPGFLVAHDVIDHMTNTPSFEAELTATGAAMYGRAYQDEEGLSIIADDFADFLIDQDFKVKPASARLSRELDDDGEKHISRVMHYATRRLILKSIIQGISSLKKEVAAESLKRSADWMRVGWRMAERAYRGNKHSAVTQAYFTLTSKINNDHDASEPYEGERLLVKFNHRTLRSSLKRLPPQPVA